MASATCNVCIDKYNKSSRKQIVCPFCQFEACNACVTRFLCESSSDPACMQCNKTWNRDFLADSFTKKFLNDTLKKHRQHQLFEREIALLPATQPLVERHLLVNQLIQKRTELTARREQLKRELEECKRDLLKIWDDIADAQGSAAMRINPQERREFVRKCPCEGCKGFLSTAWKCSLCNNFTCPNCLEIKGTDRNDHVCKPENVETAKLLAKDTKPCPGCGEMIHRIEGCAQMWHWCGTAWNWNTGRIETGVIHNPHFYEWQRKHNGAANQRPIGDVPCGGIPTTQQLSRPLAKLGFSVFSAGGYNLSEYIQAMHHLHEVTRRQYMVNNMQDNADLRVRYMLNEITDDRFKQLLQQREKARLKKISIEQVIAMAYTVSGDVLRTIANARNREDVLGAIKQLLQLQDYSQDCMNQISNQYDCAVPAMRFEFKAR